MKKFSATVSRNLLDGTLTATLTSSKTGDKLVSLPVIPARPEHRSYIISTWVKSYEPAIRRLIIGPTPTRIDPGAYRAGESGVAERHWEKALVVVSEDDAYTIHGWVCAREGFLWHVYVAPTLRDTGLGTKLVEATAGRKYAVSKPWPERMQPSGHEVQYDPWGAM